jgi:hypothetical protein
MVNSMNKLKDLDHCKNSATHHRNLNDVENGICILGDFTGIHRSFCWCDLQNIDVKKKVELSCVICLLYEKGTFSQNPPKNMEFSSFMDVIFEQELRRIRTAAYDINCGLSPNEQTKCIEKFDRIYNKFMKDWE